MSRPLHDTSVSDLDLMLYFDGELSDERRLEVERFLASAPTSTADSARARDAENKLYGLALVGDYLRETATGSPGTSSEAADLSQVEAIMSRLDEPAADDHPDVPRASTGAGIETTGAPPARAPANDNGRRIWALTALAAAAAAALVVWGISDGAGGPDAGDRVTMVPTHEGPLPEPAAPTSAVPDLEGLAVEGQSDLGVEVSSVDFGSNSGAIFYVPPGKAAGTGGGADQTPTTVVWLADGDD